MRLPSLPADRGRPSPPREPPTGEVVVGGREGGSYGSARGSPPRSRSDPIDAAASRTRQVRARRVPDWGTSLSLAVECTARRKKAGEESAAGFARRGASERAGWRRENYTYYGCPFEFQAS
ncbi:hypothetical protein MTO96_020600 [Rhipicephalus appendiculatus]